MNDLCCKDLCVGLAASRAASRATSRTASGSFNVPQLCHVGVPWVNKKATLTFCYAVFDGKVVA